MSSIILWRFSKDISNKTLDKNNQIRHVEETNILNTIEETLKSLKEIFKNFKETHDAGSTKREISNQTSEYIQKCRDILEKE